MPSRWYRCEISFNNPHSRREPGGDNPHPVPDRTPTDPNPSLEQVTRAKKMPSLGTSWAFPWAWMYSQVFRGPEELEGARESRPAPVSRPGSRLKSSESDPKTEAVEAWWPVDHDKTASCSCPVQKSKNFVSRAQGTLRCAPCSFAPGVSKVSSACSARQRQSSRRSWSTPGLPSGTHPPQRRHPRRFSPNGAAGRDPPVFQSRATYSLSPC